MVHKLANRRDETIYQPNSTSLDVPEITYAEFSNSFLPSEITPNCWVFEHTDF